MTTYTQDLAAPLPVVLQAHTGNTTTLYLFDMGTRPLAEYDSAWEYLLPDGLGSVRQLVDAGGNVKLAESYEPYGSVLSSLGSATSAFGFTGEQLDNYIGLVFLRARYMQPTVGVFLSRDPWSGDTLRPLTYNGWAYVEGNPVNRNDPSGYCGGGGPSGSKARVCGTASNNPPGLAFRSGAGIGFPTINPPDRLQDGTQVQLLSASTQPDVNGLRWRQVSIDGGAKGYVADVYLEPVSSGGGGTGERWWPFGKGVGYLKGKLYEGPSPLHNGIDLISANDPLARYARSVPGQGFTYNSICANTSPNVNNTSREVYAIADGKIESIAPAGSDVNSSLINQTWTANGNTYWVQYTHVKAEISEGQQVYKDAPTLIGRYGFYGNHGNIAHLHLTVKVNGQLANPGDYLPDASPVFPPGLFPIWGP